MAFGTIGARRGGDLCLGLAVAGVTFGDFGQQHVGCELGAFGLVAGLAGVGALSALLMLENIVVEVAPGQVAAGQPYRLNAVFQRVRYGRIE